MTKAQKTFFLLLGGLFVVGFILAQSNNAQVRKAGPKARNRSGRYFHRRLFVRVGRRMPQCTAPVLVTFAAAQRIALHAVAALEVIVATAAIAPTSRHTRPRPTPRRRVVGAGRPAAAQDRAGREQARPWYTRLPRFGHSHPSGETVEKRAVLPDLRDVFLCHAWTTGEEQPRSCAIYSCRAVSRSGSARMTLLSASHLCALSTKAWRSRESGSCWLPLRWLKSLPAGGVADKELSVLLRSDQLVPIMHGATYEALGKVSLMLASRNGLDTAGSQMAAVADKLAELVKI